MYECRIGNLMVGRTISNLQSRLYVLLMQCLSLYLQFYAKSNFNILYMYTFNVFMLQLCTLLRTIKSNNMTMDGLEFIQLLLHSILNMQLVLCIEIRKKVCKHTCKDTTIKAILLLRHTVLPT